MIDNKTISICFVRDVTNNVEVYNFTLGARLRSSYDSSYENYVHDVTVSFAIFTLSVNFL